MLTGLAHELLEQSAVDEVVSGSDGDDDKRQGSNVDQKADEKTNADAASPAPPVDHHAIMDGDGVERVGRR